MESLTREITKEQYERGMKNNRCLTQEDRECVFNDSERLGYGVYGGTVSERDGKFYVDYSLGSTCD